jgi:hypothetical protein
MIDGTEIETDSRFENPSKCDSEGIGSDDFDCGMFKLWSPQCQIPSVLNCIDVQETSHFHENNENDGNHVCSKVQCKYEKA